MLKRWHNNLKVRILSTSDVHGYVYPTNYTTRDNHSSLGMLQAGSIIKNAKKDERDDEIVIAVENGDWIQGSPFSTYLSEQAATKQGILSEITANVGYDAATLGNHEFNYGQDYIKNAESKRNYPIVNANIEGAVDNQIADRPYMIIEKKGLKIAILGLTTAFIPNWERPDNIKGLAFQSALATAKKFVPELRKQADVVIVAYHGGIETDPQTGKPTEKYTSENEGYRIATEVPGIDALITGHQHRQLAAKINGVPFTQPGVHGSDVGEIDLDLNEQKQIINCSSHLISTKDTQPNFDLISSNQIEDEVQDWLDQPMGQATGVSMIINDQMKVRTNNHPYIDFINKVEMDAMGVDIAGTALFNDDIKGFHHDISMREIINGYSYPNTIMAEAITGAELKRALEKCAAFFKLQDDKIVIDPKFVAPKMQLFNYDIYSGIDYEFDVSKPVGKRVVKLNYHGKPVTTDQKLRIALNNYRAIGGGDYNMFSAKKVVNESPDSASDLIVKYLKKHDPYEATTPHNLKVTK